MVISFSLGLSLLLSLGLQTYTPVPCILDTPYWVTLFMTPNIFLFCVTNSEKENSMISFAIFLFGFVTLVLRAPSIPPRISSCQPSDLYVNMENA